MTTAEEVTQLYLSVPSSTEIKNGNVNDLAENTTDYSYEVSTFGTNAKKTGASDDDYRSYGSLGLGVKSPIGKLQYAAVYTPPKFKGKDGQSVKGGDCDISNSVQALPDTTIPETSVHFVKIPDALGDYGFDIIVSNFGTDDAAFMGTLKFKDREMDWSGEFVARKKVTEQATVIDIPKPENLQGTIEELSKISPIAWKNEGRVKVGDDAAQVYGDDLMNKIMMHALDDETKKSLLPNLEPLGPTEQAILEPNRSYFRRAAIHLLADQLKEMEKVDGKIKGAIKTKFQTFMKMLTSPTPPEKGEDPVVTYGWDRKNNKAELDQLRQQYSNVTMRCYQEGYKVHCPQWTKFLKHASYWFKNFATVLKCKETVGPWQTSLIRRGIDDKAMPAQQEILMWGNKLSMLKSAAPPEESPKLDVDEVTGYLSGQASMALAYAQLVDEEFEKRAKLIYTLMDQTKGSQEFQAKLAERKDYSADIDTALRLEGIAVLSRLVSQNSNLAIEAEFYWQQRLPPGARGGRLTVAQILTSWEDAKRLEWMREADNLPPLDDGPRKTLMQRVKSGAVSAAKATLSLLKAAFHAVAFVVLFSQLLGGAKDMDIAQLGRSVSALASEAINIIGMIGRKILNWMWNKGYVFQKAVGWFYDALKTGLNTIGKRFVNALVGSIGKVVRLLGLIGCIFSIISSYWDMDKASKMDKNDAAAYLLYSRVSFALGCLEGLVIVAGIAAEVFGWVGVATICGPLGIAIGVIALTVGIVYYAFFAPDPYGDIKKFLRGEGVQVGSYDKSKEG